MFCFRRNHKVSRCTFNYMVYYEFLALALLKCSSGLSDLFPLYVDHNRMTLMHYVFIRGMLYMYLMQILREQQPIRFVGVLLVPTAPLRRAHLLHSPVQSSCVGPVETAQQTAQLQLRVHVFGRVRLQQTRAALAGPDRRGASIPHLSLAVEYSLGGRRASLSFSAHRSFISRIRLRLFPPPLLSPLFAPICPPTLCNLP